MTHFDPSEQWQTEQHQRIMAGDVTAFAELCEQALPHLLSFVRAQFPQVHPHVQESIIIDCLLSYSAAPDQYDSQQLSLLSYLRMAVRGDMLNALQKQKRYEQRLADLDDPVVEQQLAQQADSGALNALDDWLQTHTQMPRQDVLRAMYQELAHADRAILLLMLDGVRDTARFAAVLGVANKDILVQRQAVKRAKDRIKKQLQRFAAQLK